MEKSEVLKDDDQDEENDQSERDGKNDDHGGENEDRPIKTKLPGMVIPYLESIKGSVGIKY